MDVLQRKDTGSLEFVDVCVAILDRVFVSLERVHVATLLGSFGTLDVQLHLGVFLGRFTEIFQCTCVALSTLTEALCQILKRVRARRTCGGKTAFNERHVEVLLFAFVQAVFLFVNHALGLGPDRFRDVLALSHELLTFRRFFFCWQQLINAHHLIGK